MGSSPTGGVGVGVGSMSVSGVGVGSTSGAGVGVGDASGVGVGTGLTVQYLISTNDRSWPGSGR